MVMSGPSHSNGETTHFAGLEDKFCKDFTCCGLMLENLHDLLQHFEECHVHVESDGEDDEDDDHHLPFEFESTDEMDTDMDDIGTPPRLFNLVCYFCAESPSLEAIGVIFLSFVIIYTHPSFSSERCPPLNLFHCRISTLMGLLNLAMLLVHLIPLLFVKDQSTLLGL
jgi:hypothetical protein